MITEGAEDRTGIVWLRFLGSRWTNTWQTRHVSGTEGVTFDQVKRAHIDADGDLDVITCEEASNLGVIWYENPAFDPGK